jgi:hypothetical protein
MKTLKFILIVLTAGFLTGCLYFVQPSPSKDYDYGASPENYQELVKAYVHEHFKNPDDVIYQDWVPPYKGGLRQVLSPMVWGWEAQVSLNFKGETSYSGFETYNILFKDGKIVIFQFVPPRAL